MTIASLDLFDSNVVAFARRTDPDTSHDAAVAVTGRIRELHLAVLRYAATVQAFTDPAMNAHFGVTSSTYRTRRAELVDRGAIEDTGARTTIGDKGRRHALWRITAKGRAILASHDPGDAPMAA